MQFDRDIGCLWDMLQGVRKALKLTQGYTEQQYMEDERTRLAIERLLGIIGEAARRISSEFKQQHQHVPWQEIVGMRNILAHEYDEVRDDLVFHTISKEFPALEQELKLILPPEPEPG